MKRFAIVMVAALVACSDAVTAPPDVLGGTFTLRRYNGSALPAQIDPAFGACGAMLVAAAVADAEQGRVSFTESTRNPCRSDPIATFVRSGDIARDGSTVTITLDENFGFPEQVYSGTMTGSSLTLTSTVVYSTRELAQTFTFER